MHEQYLIRALSLAETRRGFCAPNPAVGAVLIKNDYILAEGTHWACGEPHAEVNALNKVGEEARGATLYVSLEPCCHTGRTPPCTDLIIKRGISEVIYAYRDPNPKVAGQGEARLLAVGIKCLHYPVAAIDQFYCSYAFWQQTKQPWITIKLALSLDGKISDEFGKPLAITGAECKKFTHQQRKRSDALLTTVKTIICDDPQLNVRLGSANIKKNLYLLDSQLSLPLTAQVLTSTNQLTVFHQTEIDHVKRKQLLERGVNCQEVARTAAGLDLHQIVKNIGEDGCHDIWVEAGAHCFNAFLQAKLAKTAYVYIATKFFGAAATPALTTPAQWFAEAKNVRWWGCGEDGVCEVHF